MCMLSPVWLLVTVWTVALQAPLFMGFFRNEYWSGLPFPPPEDFPDTGIQPNRLLCLLHWQADSFPTQLPGKSLMKMSTRVFCLTWICISKSLTSLKMCLPWVLCPYFVKYWSFPWKTFRSFLQKQTHRLKEQIYVYQKEWGEEIVREFEINTDTLLYLKWIKCF